MTSQKRDFVPRKKTPSIITKLIQRSAREEKTEQFEAHVILHFGGPQSASPKLEKNEHPPLRKLTQGGDIFRPPALDRCFVRCIEQTNKQLFGRRRPRKCWISRPWTIIWEAEPMGRWGRSRSRGRERDAGLCDQVQVHSSRVCYENEKLSKIRHR